MFKVVCCSIVVWGKGLNKMHILFYWLLKVVHCRFNWRYLKKIIDTKGEFAHLCFQPYPTLLFSRYSPYFLPRHAADVLYVGKGYRLWCKTVIVTCDHFCLAICTWVPTNGWLFYDWHVCSDTEMPFSPSPHTTYLQQTTKRTSSAADVSNCVCM